MKFCGECGTPLGAPGAQEPGIPGQDAHPWPTETLRIPVQELATGSTFAGRYQIIEELGNGGMGRVYKVFDTKIKEKIDLKLIRSEVASDRDTIERFSNEIRLSRRIGHRNVCRMFDIGEEDGARFITMEYVHGEDLKSLIRMSGSLSLGMLLSVGKQVSEGLAEAKEVDQRSDIYSLGVILYEMATSRVPFEGETALGIAMKLSGRGKVL